LAHSLDKTAGPLNAGVLHRTACTVHCYARFRIIGGGARDVVSPGPAVFFGGGAQQAGMENFMCYTVHKMQLVKIWALAAAEQQQKIIVLIYAKVALNYQGY